MRRKILINTMPIAINNNALFNLISTSNNFCSKSFQILNLLFLQWTVIQFKTVGIQHGFLQHIRRTALPSY